MVVDEHNKAETKGWLADLFDPETFEKVKVSLWISEIDLICYF